MDESADDQMRTSAIAPANGWTWRLPTSVPMPSGAGASDDAREANVRIVFESEEGEWLALMVWDSAVYHLHPRDEYCTTQGSSANGCAANGASRSTMRGVAGATARSSAPVAATRT